MSLDTLPTLPANLTAGQTLEFTAIYAPTAEGAHTGTITVTDNLTRVAHTVAAQRNRRRCRRPSIRP